MVKTTSRPARSAGVSTATAPRLTIGAAFDAVRLYTATS